MRVLITGAGGNLGRVLAPALVEKGHEPILLDYRKIDTPYPFIQADIRDPEAMQLAARNIDAIVHAAALHGIHLPHYEPDDFWKLNVSGTYNVYQAALKNNIKKIVFCSSIDVYGDGIPAKAGAYALGSENLPLLPNHIYGFTKKIGEEIAGFYFRKHGIHTISLRLGMFVAASDLVLYGFRLLSGGVDERDVSAAVLLALENKEIEFDFFNIVSDVPFTVDDAYELFSHPRKVLESFYPGANEIFEQNGINVEENMAMWENTYWSNQKAKKALGFDPQYNFAGFLQALKESDREYYPFAGLPWWGVTQ